MAANGHAGTRTRMRTIAIASAIVVAVALVTSVSWRASQAQEMRAATGDPPGQRFYFAYVTQDPGDGRWYVRGLGTGP